MKTCARWMLAALAAALIAVAAPAVTYVRPSVSLAMPTEEGWDDTVGFAVALGNVPDAAKPSVYELELGFARFEAGVTESGVTLSAEEDVMPLLATYQHHVPAAGGTLFFGASAGLAYTTTEVSVTAPGLSAADSDDSWDFAWAVGVGFRKNFAGGGFGEIAYRFMRVEMDDTATYFGYEVERGHGGAHLVTASIGFNW